MGRCPTCWPRPTCPDRVRTGDIVIHEGGSMAAGCWCRTSSKKGRCQHHHPARCAGRRDRGPARDRQQRHRARHQRSVLRHAADSRALLAATGSRGWSPSACRAAELRHHLPRRPERSTAPRRTVDGRGCPRPARQRQVRRPGPLGARPGVLAPHQRSRRAGPRAQNTVRPGACPPRAQAFAGRSYDAVPRPGRSRRGTARGRSAGRR